MFSSDAIQEGGEDPRERLGLLHVAEVRRGLEDDQLGPGDLSFITREATTGVPGSSPHTTISLFDVQVALGNEPGAVSWALAP